MLLLLLLTVLSAGKGLAATPDHYTAAVVELATPSLPSTFSRDQVLVYNAAKYVEYMLNASLSKADIIVFPEGGLVGRYNEGKAIELPSARDRATPCDNTSFHQVLTILSCAARRYKMYTVVSLAEAFNNKTLNKTQLFTSSLAFDRNGTVVARYRKYHPYGKTADKPPMEFEFFETDFGVTFGMLISFDIQFLEPGIILAREYGIKHFVFPHCWISALPFFTVEKYSENPRIFVQVDEDLYSIITLPKTIPSVPKSLTVQTQWAWAYGLDVVLLASGCNDPSSGATGTGLYLGQRGALQYLQTCDVTSAMLVAKVPQSLGTQNSTATFIDPHIIFNTNDRDSGPEESLSPNHRSEERQTNGSLYLLRDYVDVYESQLLPTGDEELLLPQNLIQNSSAVTRLTTKTSLCQNLLCCNFQVTVASTFSTTPVPGSRRPDDYSRLFYRLVSFDGVRSYGGGVATGGVQLCGIISCTNQSLSSCGLPADHPSAQVSLGPLHKTSTVFEAVSISADFLYNSTFVYPDILVSGSGHGFGSLVSSDSISFNTTAPRDGSLTASLKMEVPVPNLVTMAIYARQFDRDGQNRTELPFTSKARSPTRGVFRILSMFVLFFLNILF